MEHSVRGIPHLLVVPLMHFNYPLSVHLRNPQIKAMVEDLLLSDKAEGKEHEKLKGGLSTRSEEDPQRREDARDPVGLSSLRLLWCYLISGPVFFMRESEARGAYSTI